MAGSYFYESKPDEAWLSWFAVKPECQRKGIGTKVLQNIMGLTRKYGMKSLSVIAANTEVAKSFYFKNGFNFKEKIVFDNKELPVFQFDI